jgi:hypothetical protein
VSNRRPLLIDLESKEILQINVTVIAGALILLSISSSLLPVSTFQPSPPINNSEAEQMRYQAELELVEANVAINKYGITTVALGVILPFALSSFVALFTRGKAVAIFLMWLGFASLMTVLVYAFVLNQNHAFDQFREAGSSLRDLQDYLDALEANQTSAD